MNIYSFFKIFGYLSTNPVTFSTSNSQEDNYNLPNTSFLRVDTNGGTVTLTGIANGTPGRRLVISNIENLAIGQLILSSENVSSEVGNRIKTNSGGTDINLQEGDSVELIYDSDSGLWRVIRGF